MTLDEPLLQHDAAGGRGAQHSDAADALPSRQQHPKPEQGVVIRIESDERPTFWPCAFNLAKVTMGAGMMAVPKAFRLLGFPVGTLTLVSVAALTMWTLDGLVAASERTGARTYSELARRTLGRRAQAVLQAAVLSCCWIMNCVFLVVLGDILVGATGSDGACEGLICQLTGVVSGPLADRWAVLGLLTAAVLGPLASLRDMRGLAPLNIVGMAANALFAATAAALGAAALARGVAQPLPLAPQWDALAGGGGGGPLLAAMGFASTLPILLNCSVCHQSLHPLMGLLRPYSRGGMRAMVVAALAGCNVLYLVVALGAGLAFGPGLRSDVLANTSVAGMAPLLGAAPAAALALAVRLGYLVSLVGSYVLLCFPQREVMGVGPGAGRAAWLAASWGLAASYYAVACFVPSIWALLSLVGSTSSSVQAFVVPGAVILAVAGPAAAGRGVLHRALAGFAVVLGVVLFVNGLAQEVVRHVRGAGPGGDDAGAGA